MVKLGDVCEIARGGSPRPIEKYITDDESGINWIKIGDTSESKYITKTKQKILPSGMNKSRFVEVGDFLLSNSMSFGRPYIMKIDGCIHDGWLVIKDQKGMFDKDFLYFLLGSETMYRKFTSLAVGGVVNNLNSEMVRNVVIPLPPLEEQQKIATELDKITDLISKRKSQLEKLDLLIKSKFTEMFGDTVSNEMAWDTEILNNLCSKIGSGATPTGGKQAYKSEGISLVRSMNVHDGYFKYKDLAYIDDHQANKLNNVTLCNEDVLINITGASVARSCVLPSNVLPARVNQHVSILRCGNKILPIYLNNVLIAGSMKKQLLEIGTSNGATREAITKVQLEELQIAVPPIELQNKFAEYVEKVEQTKEKMQAGLEQLETLYKARMQEYFG